MEKFFTPKQIGLALGVSESSVKRWCDSGRVRAARTAGGHRKVPLSAVVKLIRESGQTPPNPEVLGLVAATRVPDMSESRDQLYAGVIAGDETVCRDIVLGFFQRGSSIAELGDDLIGPVMCRVGDSWESQEIRVHHERRASEIIMATLHELRQWLPPNDDTDAPIALCATAMRDFAEVPIRLVELVLREAGWNTALAGSGLPLEEIAAAIHERNPRLICLSLTHLEDVDAYIDAHNEMFNDDLLIGRQLVVGGGVFNKTQISRLRCDLFAPQLADLKQVLSST